MNLAAKLQNVIEKVTPQLQALAEEDCAIAPAPNKWSKKQILGHLIDSAANNHQRFVRAQFKDDLIFSGYEQEAWVTAHRYQERSWPALITFWRDYNLHLVEVIAAIDEERLHKRQTRHNFDEIALHTIPKGEPTTLGYLINDYIDHLEHHLSEILSGDKKN